MEIFSARLKFIRESKQLTSEQVANHMGISIQTYSDIECGITEPDLNTLSKIPSILGESADFLIGSTHLDTKIRNYIDECIKTLTSLLSNQSQMEKIKLSVPKTDKVNHSSGPYIQSNVEHFNNYSEKVNRFEKQLIDNNTILFDYLKSIPFVPVEQSQNIEEEIIITANRFAYGYGVS